MLCTIYFVCIGTFIGDMPPPPPDDHVDDEEMVEAMEGERPPQVQIPMGMRRRDDIRFRMELGDQLCRLLVDEGVCPATIRDIQADRTHTEL